MSRSNDATNSSLSQLSDEIGELQDQLYFINDLLQCGVRPLNVRLCEWLLRRVVFSPLLRGMLNGDLSETWEVPDSEPSPGTPGGGRELVKSGKDASSAIDLVTPMKSTALPYASSPQSPSATSFPGAIVGKREWESGADDSNERSRDRWGAARSKATS